MGKIPSKVENDTKRVRERDSKQERMRDSESEIEGKHSGKCNFILEQHQASGSFLY